MPRFVNCDIGIEVISSVGSVDGPPPEGAGDALGTTEIQGSVLGTVSELEEYNTQVGESSITTWIASETGKEFAITFCAENYPCSLQLVIFVDGVELVNRGYDVRRMGKTVRCTGVSIDADTVKPFVFADLGISEEDGKLGLPDQELDVEGTIRIEVLRVVFVESRAPTYYVPGLANLPGGQGSRVSGTRGVRLGQQKTLRTKKMTSMPFDPEHPEPIAVFNYVYRPRETLLAQGIIPPPKPPTPPPPTYPRRFVEDFSSQMTGEDADDDRHRDSQFDPDFESEYDDDDESYLSRRKEDEIRRLRAQQERVRRELKELEEIRRLRELEASLSERLEALQSRPRTRPRSRSRTRSRTESPSSVGPTSGPRRRRHGHEHELGSGSGSMSYRSAYPNPEVDDLLGRGPRAAGQVYDREQRRGERPFVERYVDEQMQMPMQPGPDPGMPMSMASPDTRQTPLSMPSPQLEFDPDPGHGLGLRPGPEKRGPMRDAVLSPPPGSGPRRTPMMGTYPVEGELGLDPGLNLGTPRQRLDGLLERGELHGQGSVRG